MKTKECSKCKKELPIIEFYRGKDRDGLRYKCKKCMENDRKKYYKEHKEEIQEYQKEYDKLHKKERSIKRKKYYINNKIKILKQTKKYFRTHKEKMMLYLANYKLQRRKLILKHYGNKCICCSEKRIEFLAIDHINNDGSILKRKYKIGDFYNWIIKNNFPKNLQILCHNCNMSKGFYGYCPHEKKQEEAKRRPQ